MNTHLHTEIAWEECGTAKKGAIIFLHAMAGSATAWDPQMKAFASDYRCIAWDMPGFGESADAPDNADMDWVVKSLAHFVSHTLGLGEAHFVGLSVGGMILQHFAAAHPDLVQSHKMYLPQGLRLVILYYSNAIH